MSLGARHDLIFGHEGNARAATSVILIGVLAALIGSVFVAIGPTFKQEPRRIRDAYMGPAPAPVRMIGQVPRENGSCDQQVWPNIDQRCLVRTEATLKSGNTSSLEHSDKLSPPMPTAKAINHQSSLQENASMRSYAAAPAPLEEGSLHVTEPSDMTVGLSDDNVDELRQQEPIEPPRKRARRHYRPFHLHFGAFRF